VPPGHSHMILPSLQMAPLSMLLMTVLTLFRFTGGKITAIFFLQVWWVVGRVLWCCGVIGKVFTGIFYRFISNSY
jgi:hypothetical protein